MTRRSAWLLVALPWIASCSDDPVSTTCPLAGLDPGPALSDPGLYCVAANSLSETWLAWEQAGDSLLALAGVGFTGQAPNDLEVAGDRLYAVNSLDNSISVVDLSSGATLDCLDVGTNTSPYELTLDPYAADRAWLTTYVSGEVLEIDLAGLRVLRRVELSPTLEGLWVGETEVAVTLTAFDASTFEYGTGEVIVLAKSDLTEIARFSVPTNPQAVFGAADGLLHVVCTGDYGFTSSGRVSRIEADFSAVRDTLELGGAPGRVAVASDGRAYLSTFSDGLLVYDTLTFTALRDASNPMLGGVWTADVEVLGSFLVTAGFNDDSVILADLDTGTALWTVPAGDGPVALVVADRTP